MKAKKEKGKEKMKMEYPDANGGADKEKSAKSDAEEYEKEENDDEEKSCAKKSEDLTEDDLEKSLSKLEQFQEENDETTRKQALLEKAQSGELSKSEKSELIDIIGGKKDDDDGFADTVEKAMKPDDAYQKSLDVSDYLEANHEETVRVTKMLAERIEKSEAVNQEFNILSSKAIASIGHLVKSLSEKFDQLSSQPARAPKSQAIPLAKGFAGSLPDEEQLSKSEVLDTMSEIVRKSCEDGQGGRYRGINMVHETAKYEQTGHLGNGVLQLVKQYRGAGQ